MMDDYTRETQDWLNQRFRYTDKDGVYFSHQPIYGFRVGHCEDSLMMRYTTTYQILLALSRLEFTTFLDIGGAEGYKSALVRDMFGVEVHSCDLSEEATKRAMELFGVEGSDVDIHHLPFQDNQFDVVTCSETLEHVPDINAATRELLRVAKRAVVITVPKEPLHVVERNIREKTPHGHIHALTTSSFDWVKSEGYTVIARHHISRALSLVYKIVAGEAKDKPKYSSIYRFFRNRILVGISNAIFGKGAVIAAIRLDDRLSAKSENCNGLSFILLKGSTALAPEPRKIDLRQMMDFKVPFLYLTPI